MVRSAFCKIILVINILPIRVLDTIHCAFVIHSLYWYLITNFANPNVIPEIVRSIMAGIFVTPISDTIVRWFFAWRIWVCTSFLALTVTNPELPFWAFKNLL